MFAKFIKNDEIVGKERRTNSKSDCCQTRLCMQVYFLQNTRGIKRTAFQNVF